MTMASPGLIQQEIMKQLLFSCVEFASAGKNETYDERKAMGFVTVCLKRPNQGATFTIRSIIFLPVNVCFALFVDVDETIYLCLLLPVFGAYYSYFLYSLMVAVHSCQLCPFLALSLVLP